MPRKKPNAKMVELAELRGAMRGKRPDWYALALHLVEVAYPQYLTEGVSPDTPSKLVPPPEKLIQDVMVTAWMKQCGVGKACNALRDGDLPETFRLADGTWVVVPKISDSWTGKKGLKTRFFEAKKELGKTRK